MKIFGLLGYPLGHSFSQKYFSEKFEAEGINAAYQNFEFSNVREAVGHLMHLPSLRGFNITIPYKEKIIQFLQEADVVVQAVGACNCIKVENGKWLGYNTDVIGFEKMVEPYFSLHKRALILGTGGAAKAVAYVLTKHGIDYKYVSRNKEKGTLVYNDLNEDLLAEFSIIINSTPLGMSPHTQAMPAIPYGFLGSGHLVIDLIYNPPETLYLQKAKSAGATIINGQKMLKIQAEESWKIWNS